MLLLTDGTVMLQGANKKEWKKLTPDAFGNYVNGDWSDIASMTTQRLYYASAVLADGRVFVAGAEYIDDDNSTPPDEYNKAQVYDPVANTWTSEITPLGWSQVGDAAGTILADGRFLFGNSNDNLVAIYDSTVPWGSANTFTAAAAKLDNSSEESWVLMPDGTVFTVQCGSNLGGTERYLPASNQWIPMANVPAWPDTKRLVENSSGEIGPAFLLPDGRVFQVGCTGHNGLFVPGPLSTDLGSWIIGPDYPLVDNPINTGNNVPQGSKDGPGSWLPNGDVLVTVGPVDGIRTNYLNGVQFYLYHPGGVNQPGTLTPETAAPNTPSKNYQGRMLLLPSGQALYTGQSDDVYAYTYSSGGPDPAWKPKITSWPGVVEAGQTYSVFGQQFNGVSQGANYGDDAEMSSNYPLVRIRNHATGHVFYCRTHDHSTMGVATGTAIVSTFFDTPAGLESGLSDLIVVANGVPSDPIIINGPALAYNAEKELKFGSVCPGTFSDLNLSLYNVGAQDITINGLQRVGGSTDFTVLANPKVPLTIAPGSHVDFSVRYTPTATNPPPTTIRITSNDPNIPTVDLTATGSRGHGTITTLIAQAGSFGNVCVGSLGDLPLTINNSGNCDLTINNITIDSTEFLIPSVMDFPVVIHSGGSLQVPIRFKPTSFGANKSGTFFITSDDPAVAIKSVAVSGTAPTGDIRVTGSTTFGNVCAGSTAEKVIVICNEGGCNLMVSSVAFDPACGDFTIINNPFPATVLPGECKSVTIRFTPTNLCGDKACTLKIISDDPDSGLISLGATATAPCSDLGVAADQCFPPTVIQSIGACTSTLAFPIVNPGLCPVKITAITVTGPYSIVGLPTLPLNLQPGHTVGDGNLAIVFAPTALSRNNLGTISVTYEKDPITHATFTISRTLNGEGVRTGARVLVLGNGGIPLAKVEKIQLQRINANRNKNLLDTTESLLNATLQSFTPAAPCGTFQYHREYSTVSNPIQLLPGSYRVTATGIVDGKRLTKTVGFDVTTCTFNPNIVISLP